MRSSSFDLTNPARSGFEQIFWYNRTQKNYFNNSPYKIQSRRVVFLFYKKSKTNITLPLFLIVVHMKFVCTYVLDFMNKLTKIELSKTYVPLQNLNL